MSNDYAPFPTIELEALAAEYEKIVEGIARDDSRFVAALRRKATMLRNAVLAHNALRDRFLEAETSHRAELGRRSA